MDCHFTVFDWDTMDQTFMIKQKEYDSLFFVICWWCDFHFEISIIEMLLKVIIIWHCIICWRCNFNLKFSHQLPSKPFKRYSKFEINFLDLDWYQIWQEYKNWKMCLKFTMVIILDLYLKGDKYIIGRASQNCRSCHQLWCKIYIFSQNFIALLRKIFGCSNRKFAFVGSHLSAQKYFHVKEESFPFVDP